MKKKILIVLGLLLFLTLVNKNKTYPPDIPPNTNEVTYAEIDVIGENLINGYADPTIEYGDSSIGWLPYSYMNFSDKKRKYVETHLAKSTDFGNTWTYVQQLNKSIDGVLGNESGSWKNETSSLVYSSGQWKIFYGTWFTPGDEKLFMNSSIRFKTASDPSGTWSEEVCVIGPAENGCKQTISSLDSSLADTKLINELGTIAVGSTLYMSADVSPSLSGLGNAKEIKARKIILLSSTDGGYSWKYVNDLTTFADANKLGYLILTASSLVEQNGQYFLLTTPTGAISKKDKNHDGFYIFEFENIRTGTLKRNSGDLLVVKRFGEEISGGGLGDYDEKNIGGIVGSNFYADGFKIRSKLFSTGQKIY